MKKLKKGLFTFFASTSLATSLMLVSCGTPKYTYAFDVNGGESQENVELEEGQSYNLPNPTKEGYLFLGWYDNASFSGDPITSITASKDMTFYAKWVKCATLKLDLNGATLSSGETSLTVAVGEKLSDALASYTPKLGELGFAGWYLNGKPLADSDVMPEGEVTVKAMFGQKYFIEYYINKVGSTTEFELYDTVEEAAMIGDTVTPEPDLVGCTFDSKNTGNVTSIVVSSNTDSNVIKFYYLRNEVKYTFNANYPVTPEDEETATKEESTLQFGQKIKFPSFACKGYEIVGWSRTLNGGIVYENNTLLESAYNGETKVEPYTAERNSELYAVWKKCHTDMRGGSDEIYLFNSSSDTIYMKRDGVYFVGKYDALKGTFRFTDPDNEDHYLYGKIIDDSTFAYEDENNIATYSYYDMAQGGVNTNITISFDKFDGIKYIDKTDQVQISNGTYTVDTDGYYTATFTDGPLAGKTIEFMVATLGTTNAFLQKNEEDVSLGSIPIYSVNEKFEIADSKLAIALDGYGTTTFGGNTYFYSFFTEDNTKYLSLEDEYGNRAYLFKLTTNSNNEPIYILFNSSLSFEATLEDGTDTLTLDGSYTATLNKGTTETTGNFYYETTALGYVVITAKFGDTTHKYFVNHYQNEETFEETFTYKEIDINYHEYYYYGADGQMYKAPLIVIEDATNATLYGMTSDNEFVVVSKGTYTVTDGVYTYTAVTFDDAGMNAISDLINLKDVKSVTFTTLTKNNHDFTFWSTYTTKSGKVVEVGRKYSILDEEGNATGKYVQIIGDSAVYFDGTNKYDCEYMEQDDILGFAYRTDETSEEYEVFYVSFDDKTSTCVFCEYPYVVYAYTDGTADKNTYLSFDKYGNVTYNVVTTDDNNKQVTTTLNGTVEKVFEDDGYTQATSPTGNYIFQFSFTDSTELKNFKYIQASDSSNYYFFKENNDYVGTYSTGNINITLDGYEYYADVYVQSSGNEEEFMYYIDEENEAIILYNSSYSMTFNITDKAEKRVEMLGVEKGEYLVLDNQQVKYAVELDGKYNAKVYSYDPETDTKTLIDGNATYDVTPTNDYTITYKNGNVTNYITGNIFTYNKGSNSTTTVFVVSHEDVSNKYIDATDWSILDLDAYGNASFYQADGKVVTGTYVIINDSLLYFRDYDQTIEVLYEYDIEGLMTKVSYKEKSYFSENLDSIIFYGTGTVSINGEEGFYFVDSNGVVTLYLISENGNKYGFEEVEFGELTPNLEYKGITYNYYAGVAVPFERNETNTEIYPVLSEDGYSTFGTVNFTPSGEEFEVDGQIIVNTYTQKLDADKNPVLDENGKPVYEETSKPYSCTVVREKDGDKFVEYVLVNNFKVFIDSSFSLNSDGESTSTYNVIGLSYIEVCYESDILNQIQMIYENYGKDLSDLATEYGGIIFYRDFDEEGNKLTDYITNTINSEVFNVYTDSLGAHLTFDKASYTEDESGYIITETKGSDGYTYKFYLQSSYIKKPKYMVGMNIAYLTRVNEFIFGEYTVVTEQVISNNYSNEVAEGTLIGELFSAGIKHNGEFVEINDLIVDENGVYYAITRGDTETTYYKIDITGIQDVTFDNGEKVVNLAPIYTNVEFAVSTAVTYKNTDGDYIEVLADNNAKYLYYNGKTVYYDSVSYNSETNTYTFTEELTNEVKTYTVVVAEDNTITVTAVSTPKESE